MVSFVRNSSAMKAAGISFVVALCCSRQLSVLMVAMRDDGTGPHHSRENCFDNNAMVMAKSEVPHGVRASSGAEHAKVALVEVASNHPEHSGALGSSMEDTTPGTVALRVGTCVLILSLCFLVVCGPCICFQFCWKQLRKKQRERHVVNGRVVYEWSQSASTVTLYAIPPSGSESSLEVTIFPDRLKIGRKGKPSFMDGELFSTIDVAVSSWWINQDQGELEVCLTKVVYTDWPCVFKEHLPTAADDVGAGLDCCADESPFAVEDS
jgi:hypothetical protein